MNNFTPETRKPTFAELKQFAHHTDLIGMEKCQSWKLFQQIFYLNSKDIQLDYHRVINEHWIDSILDGLINKNLENYLDYLTEDQIDSIFSKGENTRVTNEHIKQIRELVVDQFGYAELFGANGINCLELLPFTYYYILDYK